MAAEPGNEMAAGATGRGRLRASHADREHVIAMLKAAFVQGRLTKDELDARVGPAFTSRTYAELAALTADLPAGLTAALPPGRPNRERTGPPLGRVVAGAILIVPPPATVAAAFLTGNEKVAIASALVVVIFFMAWMVVGAQMLANWHDNRSRGQLPPRPAQRGQALEHERDGAIGSDLVPCEASGDVRTHQLPGHGAIQRIRWSLPVCRDQAQSAGMQVTA